MSKQNFTKLKIENYEELEILREEQASKFAIQKNSIKDFNGYIVATAGYFGLVLLVYKNDNLVYIDEQLHYPNELADDEIVAKMIEKANQKLFAEHEIEQPLKNYTDFWLKLDFLNNYYSKYHNGISMYNADEKCKNWYFAGFISFCYYKKEEDFNNLKKLYEKLTEQHLKKLNTKAYFNKAIKFELANHEAMYGGWDSVINALNSIGLTLENLTDWQKIATKQAYNTLCQKYW